MRWRATAPLLLAATLSLALVVISSSCSRTTREQPSDSDPDLSASIGRPAAFRDVTRRSGIAFRHHAGVTGEYWLPEEMGPGGAVFDYDSDGDMDLFLVQGGELREPWLETKHRLFRNDGDFRFVDVTESSGELGGSDHSGYGMGAAAADVDADGDVDLYVTRMGPNQLLTNAGDGSFYEIAGEAGVADPGFGTSVTFLDYDRDGRLDLYVTNYVDWQPSRETTCYDPRGLRDYCNPMEYDGPAQDRLFRGIGGGRFHEATATAGIAGHRGNGLGVVAVDFDGDGWTDIYVANDQTPGFLWMNQRDGTFIEDAALRGAAFNADAVAIAGMGIATEDLDGDGDFDLLVTNIHGQPHLGLRNDGELFIDQTHRWGLAGWGVPYTGFGIALFDQDLDGRLDALIANGAVNRLSEPFDSEVVYAEPNQLVRRDAEGRFFDATGEAGEGFEIFHMSRAVLTGDFDGDGDLDAVITNNRGRTQVLRNDTSSGHSWLAVELAQPPAGTTVQGSRVTVTLSSRSQLREFRPSQGYLGSNDPRLFFGLESATSIEQLEVHWADGSRQRFVGLPTSKRVALGRVAGS